MFTNIQTKDVASYDASAARVFGENLAACLWLIGSNTRSLAMRLGVSEETTKWCSLGSGLLTQDLVAGIARDLKLPPDSLFHVCNTKMERLAYFERMLHKQGWLTVSLLLGYSPDKPPPTYQIELEPVSRFIAQPDYNEGEEEMLLDTNAHTPGMGDEHKIVWNDNDDFGLNGTAEASFNLQNLNVRKKVIENLQALLPQAGLSSLDELAEKAKLKKPANWWNQVQTIRAKLYGTDIDAFADALGVSSYVVLSGDGTDAIKSPDTPAAAGTNSEVPDTHSAQPDVTNNTEAEKTMTNISDSGEPVWDQTDLIVTLGSRAWDLKDNQLREKIVGRVRRLVDACNGLTLTALNDDTKLGKPSSWWRLVETSKTRIYGTHVRAVADYFNADVDTLITGAGMDEVLTMLRDGNNDDSGQAPDADDENHAGVELENDDGQPHGWQEPDSGEAEAEATAPAHANEEPAEEPLGDTSGDVGADAFSAEESSEGLPQGTGEPDVETPSAEDDQSESLRAVGWEPMVADPAFTQIEVSLSGEQEFYRLKVLNKNTEPGSGVTFGDILDLAANPANVDWKHAFATQTKEGQALMADIHWFIDTVLSHPPEIRRMLVETLIVALEK